MPKVVMPEQHKKVFICSPLIPIGATAEERTRELAHNRRIAEVACKCAVRLGYMPLAPHLFFPLFLSDNDPEEREAGIRFGLEWLKECDEIWVIGQRVSDGMKREIVTAVERGIPVIQFVFHMAPFKRSSPSAHSAPPTRKAPFNYLPDPGYDEDADEGTGDYDDDEEGLLYDGD